MAERLRADARRNREQMLRFARDLFLERGIDCPLEDVARAAGVGIATLYRRFGDRAGLVTAVLVDALEESRAVAEKAAGAEGDGLDAIAGYLREMLDVRVSAVIPLALDRLDDDAGLVRAREESARAVQRLVDVAHEDGSLPASVTFGDLGTLLVRLSRPLPGGVPNELDNRLAHRHLDLVLAGLRSGVELADGSGPSREDLHRLRD